MGDTVAMVAKDSVPKWQLLWERCASPGGWYACLLELIHRPLPHRPLLAWVSGRHPYLLEVLPADALQLGQGLPRTICPQVNLYHCRLWMKQRPVLESLLDPCLSLALASSDSSSAQAAAREEPEVLDLVPIW